MSHFLLSIYLSRLTDQLGEDFFAPDLEGFLKEYALLPSQEEMPKLIRDESLKKYSPGAIGLTLCHIVREIVKKYDLNHP